MFRTVIPPAMEDLACTSSQGLDIAAGPSSKHWKDLQANMEGAHLSKP